jgi:CHAP domain/Putative peptidoglycan binding domain
VFPPQPRLWSKEVSMTDTVETEPQDEAPVVIEDTEEDRERMRELDERVEQEGIQGGEPDEGTRGLGSPKSMVAEARKHLGYREKGENDTIFNRWLGAIGGYPHGGFGYPWCHAFVSYCLSHSDNGGAGPRTAGCVAGVGWFKQRNRFSGEPRVGDLVYYGKDGGVHVELVVGVGPNTIKTIGGNTSGSVGGQKFFNGNGVYEKTVQRSSRIFGYGHPAYGTDAAPSGGGGGGGAATSVKPMTTIRSVRQQQEAANALGFTPKLDVDGEWGPKTVAGVKWLQKKIGAGADGEWGQETERLFRAASG